MLQQVPPGEPETGYLRWLARQVDRAVEKNRRLAEDVQEAHTWLRRIADGLRYPPAASSAAEAADESLTSEQVKREMEELLATFQPDPRRPAG